MLVARSARFFPPGQAVDLVSSGGWPRARQRGRSWFSHPPACGDSTRRFQDLSWTSPLTPGGWWFPFSWPSAYWLAWSRKRDSEVTCCPNPAPSRLDRRHRDHGLRIFHGSPPQPRLRYLCVPAILSGGEHGTRSPCLLHRLDPALYRPPRCIRFCGDPRPIRIDRESSRPRPILKTGVDSSFLVEVVIVLVFGVAAVPAFRKLAMVVRHLPVETPR